MATQAVTEDFEDFEVDEVVDEGEVLDDDVSSSENGLTNTSNFMGVEPETVDAIEDLGVEVVEDNEDELMVVRVTEDIGPIRYGPDEIEMKRGRRYRVARHIYEYLRNRDLLWESQ